MGFYSGYGPNLANSFLLVANQLSHRYTLKGDKCRALSLYLSRSKGNLFITFLGISLLLLVISSVDGPNSDIISNIDNQKRQYHAFAQSIDNFLTYENSTYGVRIDYPADWTYYGTVESDGFIDIVVFQAPFEGRADLSSALFFVSRDTLPSDMSLKEYADMIINSYKLSDPNFEIVESSTDGSTSLLGRPAYRILSTTVLDGITYKILEIGTIIGNNVYIVTYNAEETESSKYQSLAEDMVNSFQVVGLSDNNISAGDGGAIGDTIPGNMTLGENTTIGSNIIADTSNMTLTNQTALSSPFVSYENTTYGIRMQYPTNWEIQEYDGNLIFLSPLESDVDTFREGLGIIIQSTPSEGMILDNFVNTTLDTLIQTIPNLQVITSFQTNLANSVPAHLVEYTWTNPQNNIEMKTMEVYAIANGKSYIISYGAPQEKYDRYLPTIQSMIQRLYLD